MFGSGLKALVNFSPVMLFMKGPLGQNDASFYLILLYCTYIITKGATSLITSYHPGKPTPTFSSSWVRFNAGDLPRWPLRNKTEPQCGFSRQAIEILQKHNAEYSTFEAWSVSCCRLQLFLAVVLLCWCFCSQSMAGWVQASGYSARWWS